MALKLLGRIRIFLVLFGWFGFKLPFKQVEDNTNRQFCRRKEFQS